MWIKQLCNHKVWDFAKAFRARKLFGTFEKTPGPVERAGFYGCAEITFIPTLHEARQRRVVWHIAVCPDDFLARYYTSRVKPERAHQFWREVLGLVMSGWPDEALVWTSRDLSKPSQPGSGNQSWSSIISNIFKYLYLVLKEIWISRSRKCQLFILGVLVSHTVLAIIVILVQSSIFSEDMIYHRSYTQPEQLWNINP